ncbi:hypothetical protein FPV67DRAFT_38292 [Lyophyllum atratum]|nr:hypothetical protein FPV67DRAFT_38292 [Lyophyllum atratum]
MYGIDAFGPGTATFAIHKGLVKKSKASIRFDIPEEQFNALTVWRTRKDHTRDLKDSLCLSLSCYSRVSVKTERKTLEEVSALPSVWPSTGDLFMNVMYDGKKTNLPLSPPFIVAPNGLVDVSDFLNLGLNTIELDQFADMSGYIFILRAHHPTGAQLEQVAERRRKDQAWKDWLYKMSQPFDLPIPPDPLL